MIHKLFKQVLNILVTSVTTLAIVWLVPGARAAILPASSADTRSGQAEVTAGTRVFSYQGRLLNPVTGVPQPDGAYNMTFSIYTVESGGAAIWTETESVPVSKGLFVTLLGDTSPFNLADFTGQNLWLGLAVGTDPEATPRQRLAAVAYALHADSADTALQANSASYATSADTALQATNASFATSANTALQATNANFATSAGNTTLFNGHAYSEFYKGSKTLQINQTNPMAAGANEYWFTFGYAADQMIFWRVRPTTLGGKLRLEVETELGSNNTATYWLRVFNTGTIATGYQVERYLFNQ